MASALSTLPWISFAMERALLLIQKTIHVTNATADREVIPAKSCSPARESCAEVNVSIAPKPSAKRTAIPTPSHTNVRVERRPERTR